MEIYKKVREVIAIMNLEDITSQNPWWSGIGWEKNDRHLKKLLDYNYVYVRENYLSKKPGVTVTYGPRQVGKTTWIKQKISSLLKDTTPTDVFYLNAEMIRDRFELFDGMKSINGLYQPKYIFIDEIGAVEDWERTIKALVDQGTLEDKHVLLTGSSSLNIMKKAERLPGRMAEGQYKFRYYPLSFREVTRLYGIAGKNPKECIAQLDKLSAIMYRYFLHGGFIKAMNTMHSNNAIEEDLFSIYSAWIDGELAKIRRSPETAIQILDGISSALTNEVSWSSLTKGINHVTVAEYTEILKDMFVVNYLEKSKKPGTGAPRNKKIYFIDPFIYWIVLFKSRRINRVQMTDIDNTTAGKLAEISAYACMTQYLDYKSCENDFDVRRYIHFEKQRDGEMDFIVAFGKKAVRLECKFGKIGKEKDGIIYLTKDRLEDNKIPLPIFLMFPEESLQLLKL